MTAAGPRALVVGARDGSLGHQVANQLRRMVKGRIGIWTAGLHDEDFRLDLDDQAGTAQVLARVDPEFVVCTVGMNQPRGSLDGDYPFEMERHFYTNCLLPMKLFRAWAISRAGQPGNFVFISSNSAQIARSSSGPYCASKAALSMAVRCAARDLSRAGSPLKTWVYEPGALRGTPMTRAVEHRIGAEVPMSRMLTDVRGMPTADLAMIIGRDVLNGANVLHGTVVRLDNGEQ